jgi:hypothetical protein
MTTIQTFVAVPDGYVICPFPKGWVRERERIYLSFPCEAGKTFSGSIKDVLTKLDQIEDLTTWKTSYASVKGTSQFLLGLEDDKFSINPNPNSKDTRCSVYISGKHVRLYAFDRKASRK